MTFGISIRELQTLWNLLLASAHLRPPQPLASQSGGSEVLEALFILMMRISKAFVGNCLLSSKIKQTLPQLIKGKCLSLHLNHFPEEKRGEGIYCVGQPGVGEDERFPTSSNSPTLTPQTEPPLLPREFSGLKHSSSVTEAISSYCRVPPKMAGVCSRWINERQK